MPAGITSSYFLQVYRTAPSVGADVDPGDEMGLVYEGSPSTLGTVSVSQLVRTSGTTVTATATAHGFVTGEIVRISPGGGVSSVVMAIGSSSAAQRSTDDGATWSGSGITGLSGSFNAITNSGALYVAVGANVAASSPDGLTWTAHSIPAGTYNGVTYTGSRFVAVGNGGVGAYSTDGATWVSANVSPSSFNWLDVTWNGSKLVAVGTITAYSYAASATSTDGTSWSYLWQTAAVALYSVAWNGTRFAALGAGSGSVAALYSADGLTWSAASISGVVAYGKTVWTGSNYISANIGGFYVSVDGISWTWVAKTGTWRGVCWDGTAAIAVGSSVAATSDATGAVWTSRTIGAGSYLACASGVGAYFAAGEKTVASTPTPDTFTYSESGTNGTLVAAQTAQALTIAVVDQIPSTFAGATLYTSPSQQGILASAYEPPAALDIEQFRGSVFWASVTDRASLELYVLATGTPSGIQSGDTITVNGLAYTADSSEVISTRHFQVYTSGTSTQNIYNTAASLVRIVNRAQGSTVYCRDLSGANEQPGHLQLTGRTLSDTISVSVSRAASWAFSSGVTASPETHTDELRWSPNREPDSAPVVNYKRFGDPILRVKALRDYLFVITTANIWRLSGDNGVWSITPFDSCTEVIGPDTVEQMDNILYALSTQGVVQISDTGVTIISQPVKDKIDALLAEPLRSTVQTVAHGAVYTAEGKYFLWVPTLYTDTIATHALVYDQHMSLAIGEPTWTSRTDDVSAAAVNPADGKLYTGDASALHKERKALSYTDFADGETAVTVTASTSVGGVYTISLSDGTGVYAGDAIVQGSYRAILLEGTGAAGAVTLGIDRAWAGANGAATAYQRIPSVLEFAPVIPVTGGWARISEFSLLFRYLSGAHMTVSCATEFTRAAAAATGPLTDTSGYTDIDVYGTRDYGLVEDRLFPVNLRTWAPRDCQTASRLNLRFIHSQALSPMALEGLSVSFVPTSVRLRR
jgi:hypothetical protein